MKFYITGRSSNFEKIKEVCSMLKQKGHEVTFEWTELPMVKPYEEHVIEAGKFAEQGIRGVTEADVYIIFMHKDGNGVFTEFGAALSSNAITGKPRICAIGKKQGACMFDYHPCIEWFGSVDEVFAELGV